MLIEHRGDGRYRLADAVREYRTWSGAERAAANAYAKDQRSTLVARFVFD